MAKQTTTKRALGDRGRRAFLKGASVSAVGLLAAPAIARASEKPEGTVFVESWGGAYADAVKTYILDPFKAETGIDYKHSFFGDNDEQLAKLKASKSRVDMSFLSDTHILRGVRDGVLQPIRTENVPNYDLMFDKFKRPPFDPGPEVNCCSYFYGDRAIAFNEELIKETPDSWEIFWDPQYRGRVSVWGGGTGPIELGAFVTGQDVNDITDLDAIEERLMALKPNLLKWWSSGAEQTELFASGEAWIGDFWRGRVNNLRKEGYPVRYVAPKEGTAGWVDTMTIPSTAENRRAAEALIDFALRPDIQKSFVLKGITYAPTNSRIVLDADQAALLGATPDILSGITFRDPVYTLANIDKWNELVNRLKA